MITSYQGMVSTVSKISLQVIKFLKTALCLVVVIARDITAEPRQILALLIAIKNQELTNFDPLPWFKVAMVAFFVQWIWMVAVFIGHVAQERVPFSQDKTTKTWLG